MTQQHTFDVVIVGAGGAGLRAALESSCASSSWWVEKMIVAPCSAWLRMRSASARASRSSRSS